MTSKANPKIVAAAIIERNGLILIARRKHGKLHAGKWEFPGGTLEAGETPEECLHRELREELALTTRVGNLMCETEYTYSPDFTIRLMAYRVHVISGSFDLNEHEEIRWVKPAELSSYDFPEADTSIIEQLVRQNGPACDGGAVCTQ